MKKSLARNSFFYFTYTTSNMLFPFLTNLYVARILLPVKVGEVAYAQNIVNYFAILAFLGLPTYGLREIAISTNDKKELSIVFSELFTINLLSTAFFSILYYGLIFFLPIFQYNLDLYCVVGLTVILNMFNISWLFEGLEEYKYISIRNLIFKIFMFVLVLITVRDGDDAIPYAIITVFGVAGNGVINVIHSRKYVKYNFVGLNLRRHLRPVMMLVLVNFAIELYSMVDITMIGRLLTKEHVAYYSYAGKVNKILLQITNTFTMVMVPRMSLCYKEGRYQDFNHMLTMGLKIIIIVALPLIIGIQFTSGFLFPALFGPEYVASAFVERILSILILLTPLGYLLGSRVMLVSNNEKKMIFCVSIGAIVNICLNFFLIPVMYENGAAIASVLSETIIMLVYVCFGRKVYKLESYYKSMIKVVISCIPIIVIQLIYAGIPNKSWLFLASNIVVSVLLYFSSLVLMKESVCITYYNEIKNKRRTKDEL